MNAGLYFSKLPVPDGFANKLEAMYLVYLTSGGPTGFEVDKDGLNFLKEILKKTHMLFRGGGIGAVNLPSENAEIAGQMRIWRRDAGETVYLMTVHPETSVLSIDALNQHVCSSWDSPESMQEYAYGLVADERLGISYVCLWNTLDMEAIIISEVGKNVSRKLSGWCAACGISITEVCSEEELPIW